MEDKLFLGRLTRAMNCYSPAPRLTRSLPIRYVEESLYAFLSLALEGRLSNTVLQETRCGLWKRIHLLYLHSTQLTKPISTCFEFHLRVSLALDGNLTLISRVRNINSKPFSFSIAYHTYFSISDISEVRVEGLETLDYLDNLFEKERFTEQGDTLTFESEIDRVYLNSRDVVAVFDHEKKRTFLIKKEGLPDVVVWNPWDKKAKALTDLGDEEYKHMLCVDGAAIEKPINLKPGEEWTGKLNLSLVLST
ncbi:hypothetical protein Bca4012_080229 [Brassica carinata]|uniref:putative glucose-6-phosphate 1-epimerase isoform X2 n=1 Tax=Brassica oleracea var. oleracea TaxID=109376 RepID=UPI0006A6C199|nr:PREDICTED: putative glucose-6-phosphate 1-epimerase isoform X2 [Brassica oleracea var. oleracea]XP_013598129.1 PREDICTED: putative glucose-6-phosphate 1-epimerase isoform X2 [Brassica oleracea var. oleracea]